MMWSRNDQRDQLTLLLALALARCSCFSCLCLRLRLCLCFSYHRLWANCRYVLCACLLDLPPSGPVSITRIIR